MLSDAAGLVVLKLLCIKSLYKTVQHAAPTIADGRVITADWQNIG